MREDGTFVIPVENWGKLEGKLAKLNKRANKLGCQAITIKVVGTESRELENGAVAVVKIVRVEGEEPKVAGWTFIATLEHTSEGTIVRSVPGMVEEGALISYRDSKPVCDHCKLARTRRDTYLLRDDSGTIKQVGSSCLVDFLGHGNPERYAAMAEMLTIAGELCESEEGFEGSGLRDYNTISLSAFMAMTAAVIRVHGWVSRKYARENDVQATADAAINYLERNHFLPADERLFATDDDKALADAAIDWATALGDDNDEPLNDYLYNLKTVIKGGMLNYRQLGLAASGVSAYKRMLDQAREQAIKIEQGKAHKHLGVVGKKETLVLTLVSVTTVGGGYYGPSYLHKFVDAQGSECAWFASGSQDVNEGDTYSVTATIKAHQEFRGEPQTILTRCKLAPLPAALQCAS